MNRQANNRITAIACLFAFGILSFQASAQTGTAPNNDPDAFFIKPSEVVVPEGVPAGQYRRITTPFHNWTLICDENLKAKEMVCNITQDIVNSQGKSAFSWSLAATKDGKPFMILRPNSIADPKGEISMSFPGRKQPVKVKIDGCSAKACVGMVPVGPILRSQIDKDADAMISYPTTSGATVTVTAKLQGLAEALAGIKQ